MRIAICEDDKRLCNQIAELLKKKSMEREQPYIVRTYENADALWFDYQGISRPFDLILLDIEMPGEMNGLDMARYIREREDNVTIVILTAFEKYALPGCKLQLFDYLVKPVRETELLEVVDRVEARLRLHWNDCLNLKVPGGFLRIPFGEIFYLESSGHNTFIHTRQQVHKQLSKMSDIVALCDERFLYTHKSYVVNADRIHNVGKRCTMVELVNGTVIPISQPKRKDFVKSLAEYDRSYGNIRA